MQNTESQRLTELQAEFELLWCVKVQSLVELRRSKMTQSTIAAMTGRSLKTIQRFEHYVSKDAELMFIYNRILNDTHQVPDTTVRQ